MGLWSRVGRDNARALTAELGADFRMYWIKCDDEVAWAKGTSRTGAKSMRFDSAAFDSLRYGFEGLGSDEPATIAVR
jgi:predicted kinase